MSLQRAAFLESVLASLPSLVAYVDGEQRYQFVNQAYERWFGVNRDECLGSPMSNILGDAAVTSLRPWIDAALRGEEQRFEQTVPYRHGGARHLQLHYIPDCDATGKVQGFIAIVNDLTESKRREDQHRVVLETMHDALVVKDASGVVTYANPAACAMMGLDSAAMVGRKWCDLGFKTVDEHGQPLPPTDCPAAIARREGRRVTETKMHVRLPCGSERWMRVNAAPIQDSAGNGGGCPGHVVLTFSDITAAVVAEESRTKLDAELQATLAQTRKSEAVFRDTFEHAPLGIIKLDSELRFLDVNRAYARMLGYPAEELVGKTVLELTHPEDRQLTVLSRMRVIDGAGDSVQFDKRYITKAGVIVWGRVTAHRMARMDSEGTPCLLAVIEDVSAARLAEQELVHAHDSAVASSLARTQFLANMSHEIRTPLNGILGNLELIRSECEKPEPPRALMDAIYSAEMLLGIVSDILDFSKIDAGHLVLDPAPCNLRGVVESVQQTYRTAFEEKHIGLLTEVDSHLPTWVLGDCMRIRQILNNLASNALKFTPRGSVTVSAQAGGAGEICFVVSDTGIGISEENLARLFTPFTQAESDTTRRFGGTGLGLFISRQLATLMGGSIEVSSKLGSGTTFTLRVPLPATECPNAPGIQRPPASNVAIPPLRILVAEDNVVNRTLVLRILEKGGHKVTLAENGAEAVERCAGEHFDVIFMDCQMPVMDGYEATRWIVASHGARRPRIVALTANAFKEDRERCLEAGMDHYLSKPISRAALEDVLRSIASAL